MREIILELFYALVGSFGFCLIFQLRKQFWLTGSLGGMLSWGVYLAASARLSGTFSAVLVAALFAGFYGELMARLLKAPSTIFFVPAVVPLIPGGSLYRTMQATVMGDARTAAIDGSMTLQFALGIAAGICVAWAFCHTLRKLHGRQDPGSHPMV